jgi:hypothetical protein
MTEDRQIDGAQLWATILEDAGLDSLSEVPVATSCRWFPIAGQKDYSIWEVGKNTPVNPALVVFAIFQTEDVIKVYACSLSVPGKVPAPPHRLTLTKAAPTMVIEVIALDTFIEQVAGDLQEIGGGVDVDNALILAEAIREALAAPDTNTAADILQKALKEYDEDVDETDEPEDDEEEKPEEETPPAPNGEAAVS